MTENSPFVIDLEKAALFSADFLTLLANNPSTSLLEDDIINWLRLAEQTMTKDLLDALYERPMVCNGASDGAFQKLDPC